MPAGYDFAIIGSSPLAALLAGLLAHDHRRQVLRVAEAVSPLRLPRAIDIALPFATRPETWRLLRRAEAETIALMKSIEFADAIVRTPLKIVADRPDTQSTLAHMRHVAAAYGADLRQVSRLVRPVPLDGSEVAHVDASRAMLTFRSTGAAEIAIDGEVAPIGQIVLADDAAILAHLPDRPGALHAEPMTATLTAPARRLAAPIMIFPDRGVTLLQRDDLAILGLVSGEGEIEARLASCLPGPFPLARRATSHFRRVATDDGAPLIGRLDPSGLLVIAGLGDASAFFAPPLARLLAGKSSADEQAWFAAHDLQPRQAIAEWMP